MGSTFVTALLPKMELGQREALTQASGERDQPVAIAIRGSSRRLVVVVPGLGGNSTDAMNLWFARPFGRLFLRSSSCHFNGRLSATS